MSKLGVDLSKWCEIGPGKVDRTTGYCRITRDGKTWLAHRWAWTQAYGPIPVGHDIHHACHEKSCWNVSHLECLTRQAHLAHHGLSGAAAVYAARTTCINGHAFSHRNERQRLCVECRRRASREWSQRNRASLKFLKTQKGILCLV